MEQQRDGVEVENPAATCCAAAAAAELQQAVEEAEVAALSCRLIDTFPPTSAGTRPPSPLPPVATQNPRTALLLLLLPVDSVL